MLHISALKTLQYDSHSNLLDAFEEGGGRKKILAVALLQPSPYRIIYPPYSNLQTSNFFFF